MLAELSVLLGFLIVVSLGQAPDCEKIRQPIGLCCENLLKIAEDHDDWDQDHCDIPSKVGEVRVLRSVCDHFTCFMKKKGYLLSDNKIDRAALTKFVEQNLTDYAPNIEPLLDKSYTDAEISKCTPVDFLLRAANVLMKECPSASWEKSEDCIVLKNHFDNCPNFAFFPTFEEYSKLMDYK